MTKETPLFLKAFSCLPCATTDGMIQNDERMEKQNRSPFPRSYSRTPINPGGTGCRPTGL
jgi:hypothetical protein